MIEVYGGRVSREQGELEVVRGGHGAPQGVLVDVADLEILEEPASPTLRRTELPYIRFHDLRHTFASLMMPHVKNPQIVQEMLGHSRISTPLNIYSHLSQDIQEEAVGRFAAMFS
jgi:integrase